MAKFPKLPLWTDALLGDTYYLTPAEFGAYMRLLIAAWRRNDCALPNDDEFLSRIVGDNRNWPRLRKVLSFFHLREDGMWVQPHLLDEWESCSRYSEKQSSAGKASALKRKNRDAAAVQPKAKPNSNQIQPPSPSPSPSSPLAKANGRHAASAPESDLPGAPAKEPKPDPWKAVYDRGKEVLGQRSGGQITKLRRAIGENPYKVLAKIEDAVGKRNPAEWIAAFLLEHGAPNEYVGQVAPFP